MKIGIIIICYNNAVDIGKSLFSGVSNLTDVDLCLVNNGSKDATLEKLQELKEASGLKSTIIDIKHNKGYTVAIKAGARYLSNHNDLKLIGYINVNKMNDVMSLLDLLNAVQHHKEAIIQHHLNVINKHFEQRALLKNTFSVIDYLNRLNIKLGHTQINVIGH
ncbi:glycosyltransferase [Flavivirga amylovorans]|uniref:Glycosyltransferase n=1 Tax=Flavivirga amylovorans TaxID=870486 RepID=A0ABT8WYC7_9FLAO|nr:glycosyltransferase [Flavivirga amylovorans]MDO5986700.1 glycosyltransferase [Flavivirga amylovorans]